MRNVVITGSTRGIGFGMADEFLARGCNVVISGRYKESVSAAINKLKGKHQSKQIFGFPCNVTDPQLVEDLWNEAISKFGQVDIWINNAGISGPQISVTKNSPEQIKEVVDTNILGTIFGSQVAVKGMKLQGKGHIYNMEGAGSDGRMHDGLIIYGMSKYAISYFTKGLIKETKGSPVVVGSLSPGMVITEFISSQFENRPDEWERAKRIFNIIADRVDTVTPFLLSVL